MSTKPKSKPMSVVSHDSTEVVPKPTRRKFSLEYKLRIVQEANTRNEPGQLGALLRREGLYSSSLSLWRRQFKEAGQKAITPKKRGRKPDPTASLRDKLEKLKYRPEFPTRFESQLHARAFGQHSFPSIMKDEKQGRVVSFKAHQKSAQPNRSLRSSGPLAMSVRSSKMPSAATSQDPC